MNRAVVDASGIDPNLRHWVAWIGGAFATLGFQLRERVGDLMGYAISLIFDTFLGPGNTSRPKSTEGAFWIWLFILIIIGAAWLTVPT